MRRRTKVAFVLVAVLAEIVFLVAFAVDYGGAQRVTKREPITPAVKLDGGTCEYEIWVGRLTRLEYGPAHPRPETTSS